MKTKYLILLCFILSMQAFGDNIEITEAKLIELAKQGSPNLEQLDAGYLESKFNEQSYVDQFNINLVGSAAYEDSDEQAIASFVPVFGPVKTGTVGLSKTFEQGVGVTVSAFSDQRSTNSGVIRNANRTGYNVSFQMSLWKNLFGAITKKTQDNLGLLRKQKEYETDINKKAYFTELRKLYWSLVANQESLKIAEEQYRISQKQLRDIRARRKNQIADRGDVARIQATVSSRKAVISSLKFQREQLYQVLKEQINNLDGKNIVLAPYSIEKTVTSVLACMNTVGSYSSVPWDNTKFDEVVALVDESYKNLKTITSRYTQPELTLTGEYQSSGVGEGFDRAYDNFDDDSKSGAGVAIELSIPIDGKKKDSRTTKEILDQKRYKATKDNYILKMKANHAQIVKTISLLKDVVEAQKANGSSLKTSLKVSERKYKQARISLNDFINEQNLYLNSQFSEIDAELAAIHNILDYFKVFTETPCEMNKVIL